MPDEPRPLRAGAAIVETFLAEAGEAGRRVLALRKYGLNEMAKRLGTAAALAKGLGQDDARFWAEYAPNRHVYATMLEAQPALGSRPVRTP